MTAILGPLPCHACRRPVTIDRVGSYVRVMDRLQPHVCQPGYQPAPAPDAGVCGAWMPYVQEKCARRAGHSPTGGHRRRCVMDDDAAARRGYRAAA